jgi:hypothetical protein
MHQKSVPKAKHIYNHYPSYIVHPPYIKSKYQKASYNYKFIHHTMFSITIHYSSTIHRKSEPEDIIHQVHNPHGSHIAASINLLSWRYYSTTSGIEREMFLCRYKWFKQMGHLNQRLSLGNLMGLMRLSLSLLPDGR